MLAAVAVLASLAGCSDGGSPTAPGAHARDGESASGDALPAPRLLAPARGAVVAQDDPATGCPRHPTHGRGFRIRFDWTDVPGAAGYDLLVARRGAPLPAVDVRVSRSEHLDVACNTFVTDANRRDWTWRARARDAGGRVGPWSAEGRFEFASCAGLVPACTCLPPGCACPSPAPTPDPAPGPAPTPVPTPAP